MNENAEIVLNALKTRRSIRKFKPDMPPEETVRKIMESGTFAASGRGLQASVIVEVRDPAVRNELSETNRRIGGWDAPFDPFYGAPLLLIVLAAKDRSTRVYDGSLVMGNLMLSAHVLGISSCWIHRAKETFEEPRWRAFLRERGVEGEYEGIGFCALGYADCPYPDVIPRKPGRIFPDER